MAITFDHLNKLIAITAPQDTLSCQDLVDAIRAEEASERGINYPKIARASGKESLGGGVSVGITVELEGWQILPWEGNYIFKISGGNLVGGLASDPVAYAAGVQTLLILSAASTVVVTSDGLNTEQAALLTTAATEATKGRQMQTNKAVISVDGLAVDIYDDNGLTKLHSFAVTADQKQRTPQ